MSFSKRYEEGMRGSVIAFLSPLWQMFGSSGQSASSNEEVQRLSLENHLLKEEIARLKALLIHENKLTAETQSLAKEPSGKAKSMRQRLLSLQLDAIPARVIFRSPASWNSSLWIDIGDAHNGVMSHPVIVKNSPVLVGNSIVGIVDYVGKKQSRVRLITDSGLTPAVRALRSDAWLLAKGELHGNGKPLWRSQGNTLRGIGFNYDFSDEEGPARDLRTGKLLDSSSKIPAVPLIKVHDILVTTGMDGVFPPGLHVAEVTRIHLLKEGDYYYELEAKPTAGNLDNLSLVYVIAPLGYDKTEEKAISR